MQMHQQMHSTAVGRSSRITRPLSPFAELTALCSKICGLMNLHAYQTGSRGQTNGRGSLNVVEQDIMLQ
jgi:hypothetical protein